MVAHKVMHIQNKEGKELRRAVFISAFSGMLFNVIGEPIFSYFYTTVILGAPDKAAKALASWNAITTGTNAIIAVIVSSLVYLAIAPRLKNNGVLKKLSPKE